MTVSNSLTVLSADYEFFSEYIYKRTYKVRKARDKLYSHLSNGQRTAGAEAAPPTADHLVHMPLR